MDLPFSSRSLPSSLKRFPYQDIRIQNKSFLFRKKWDDTFAKQVFLAEKFFQRKRSQQVKSTTQLFRRRFSNDRRTNERKKASNRSFSLSVSLLSVLETEFFPFDTLCLISLSFFSLSFFLFFLSKNGFSFYAPLEKRSFLSPHFASFTSGKKYRTKKKKNLLRKGNNFTFQVAKTNNFIVWFFRT